MPLHLEYINMDNLFHRAEKKIILNKLSLLDTAPEDLEALLYTVYEDTISLIPKCECGETKGAWMLGRICPRCNTEVRKEFEIIKPIIWIEKFREDLPFLSPFFWLQMKQLFKTSRRGKNVDNIRWLCDTRYNPPYISPIIKSIPTLIAGRGYKNMINNLETVLTYFVQAFKSGPNEAKYIKAKELLELYQKNKDKLYSNYLPLINKRLFVMEISNKDIYTTSVVADIKDIARTAMLTARLDPDSKKVESNIAIILSKIGLLFEEYMKMKISGKPKLVRKHILGTRSHFTIRAVFTSLPAHYDMDEVHLPWSTLCSAFRPHVLNKLIKRGYTYKEADKLINMSVLKYNPLIDEIGKEIIEEAKQLPDSKGIPILLHRNPSLLMGSSVQLYVTKFKTNPEDRSLSASMTVMKAANADVDGDELNVVILLDEFMYKKARNFKPEHNIMSLDYYKINGFLHINAPTIATVANYLSTPEDEEETEIYHKLLGD